ncbi:MAG TPA: hypothetical protein VK735_27795 [Pseudonocardia sp.]|uniref:hypothetical protein n=1 Tax=Pseudonocardia sp. TaxID=60912 RepID=UPI002C968D43|nr:hypothetical protein [Pseudonocardia sp.]HTF51263.1 hypothetical protein [Pseudonocardia sp.]
MAVTDGAVDVNQSGSPSANTTLRSPSPDTTTQRPSTGRDPGRGLPRAAGMFQARAARFLAVAAPSLIFLGVRLVGLLTLAWLTEVNGDRLLTRLSVWDGQWMLAIAGGGYNGVPLGLVDAFGHRNPTTPLAFFPGYPAAVSVFRFVTSTSLEIAGLAVSLLASLVLAHGLARLGELVPGGSRRAGLLLVALVAAAPMGVVWSMTYSEGLFCACAVWALVGVLRRHWLLAGGATALAGTVRPTAAALLLAVGAALLVAAVRRQDSWRPWLGGLLAPLGMLGYLGYVASRTGSWTGWFDLQRRGWNSKFDGGAATLEFTRDTLAIGRSVLEVVTVGVLAGGLVLLAVCCRRCWSSGLPWPLVVYAAGVLVMDLGSNGLMNSKARLLLPAFTLLVPVALGLARRRPSTALAVVVAAALASAWFGGYALTGWSYAI